MTSLQFDGLGRQARIALTALMCFLSMGLAAARPDDTPLGRGKENQIAVLPLGRPSRRTLTRVESALRGTFNLKVVEIQGAALPKAAFYAPRNRYRAEKLKSFVSKWENWKVIGVTDRDISTTAHGVRDFGIMGLADIGGKACVVSSFRSHGGVGAVAIHEVGHTLGLPHCPTSNCVMVDAKGSGKVADSSNRFCSRCRAKIRRWLK